MCVEDLDKKIRCDLKINIDIHILLYCDNKLVISTYVT